MEGVKPVFLKPLPHVASKIVLICTGLHRQAESHSLVRSSTAKKSAVDVLTDRRSCRQRCRREHRLSLMRWLWRTFSSEETERGMLRG